jgi:cellulose synthase/poly-beta-1,6-N-acetylglucosamine synthase-like glycosyltransferase
MGKSHACSLGATRARGDWLLFLDADVRLHPGAIRSAVHYAQQHRLDLFSLWLRDGSVGFWERLLVPLCGAMIVIWYGRAAARASPRGRAFANGQFLLIRRNVYESLGGHARVRRALIEDVPLACAAAADGHAVGSAVAPELATVRMYRGLRQTLRGWQRIYLGVLSPAQMLGCIISLLSGSALPIVLLPLAAAFWFHDPQSRWAAAWTILSAAHLAVLTTVSLRFFSLARCRLRYLLLYPLSVVGVLGILLAARAARLSRRRVRGRGPTYDARVLTSAAT